MKVKAYLIFALTMMICLVAVISLISSADVGVDDIYSSYSAYQQAKELDSEVYVNKVNEYTSKIIDLKEHKGDLQAEFDKIKAEVEKLNNSNQGEAGVMTSDLMYHLLVSAGLPHEVEVIKFYTYDENSYMTSMTGTLAEINQTVQVLKESLGDWRIDIGNYSLRQNYDAYDLVRSYDSGTMLEWYDNKIVNALGEVITIDDILIQEETEEGILYTLVSLEDVKLDTEGMEKEVIASNSYYEKLMSDALANYGKQLAILEQTDYSDEVKEELRSELEASYIKTSDNLLSQKSSAAKAIENKYQKMYENEKKKVADALQLYEDKLKELRGILVDSSEIEYRLDLTFSCY